MDADVYNPPPPTMYQRAVYVVNTWVSMTGVKATPEQIDQLVELVEGFGHSVKDLEVRPDVNDIK